MTDLEVFTVGPWRLISTEADVEKIPDFDTDFLEFTFQAVETTGIYIDIGCPTALTCLTVAVKGVDSYLITFDERNINRFAGTYALNGISNISTLTPDRLIDLYPLRGPKLFRFRHPNLFFRTVGQLNFTDACFIVDQCEPGDLDLIMRLNGEKYVYELAYQRDGTCFFTLREGSEDLLSEQIGPVLAEKEDPCQEDPCQEDPCQEDPCQEDPCQENQINPEPMIDSPAEKVGLPVSRSSDYPDLCQQDDQTFQIDSLPDIRSYIQKACDFRMVGNVKEGYKYAYQAHKLILEELTGSDDSESKESDSKDPDSKEPDSKDPDLEGKAISNHLFQEISDLMVELAVDGHYQGWEEAHLLGREATDYVVNTQDYLYPFMRHLTVFYAPVLPVTKTELLPDSVESGSVESGSAESGKLEPESVPRRFYFLNQAYQVRSFCPTVIAYLPQPDDPTSGKDQVEIATPNLFKYFDSEFSPHPYQYDQRDGFLILVREKYEPIPFLRFLWFDNQLLDYQYSYCFRLPDSKTPVRFTVTDGMVEIGTDQTYLVNSSTVDCYLGFSDSRIYQF